MKNIKLYPAFNHWLTYDAIFIISDTHFDDPDCKYMDPNWITPQEHIKILKKDLNKQTILIHLGDVGDASYLDELKCYKVLITGNHDVLSKVANHFDEVYTGPLFIADRLVLSHEPLVGLENFVMNIHGHEHTSVFRHNHINLAANVYHFRLFYLGPAIKAGLLSDIPNYHRVTIDKATEKKDLLIKNIRKDWIAVTEQNEVFGIPDACKYCPNHPTNGGSGICNCTAGLPKITW